MASRDKAFFVKCRSISGYDAVAAAAILLKVGKIRYDVTLLPCLQLNFLSSF